MPSMPYPSRDWVRVAITGVDKGQLISPLNDPVQMAFTAIDVDPVSGDWNAAEWEQAGRTYYARCLVGPGGTVTLAKGSYSIWVQITASPTQPVLRGGTLQIT